jgi:hypothetical protein
MVRGRVTGVGGKPIDATVSIISDTNAAIRGATDERGEFAFTMAFKPGRYRLQFEYADLQFVGEIEVRGGSTTLARLDNWFEPVEEPQGEPL